MKKCMGFVKEFVCKGEQESWLFVTANYGRESWWWIL